MVNESEKRFNSIMDKLFQSPKPKSKLPNSSVGGQVLAGQKRPCPEFSGAGQAPLCRPWDRGDLMKRVATFKSMTWFAKPKVVSAVNCARRGWVNVDMDTIACEACGIRLLFSTPSSWNQHQVEKAALVFSLKLDSGHKLHCPWNNNICDERLAQFPPMSQQDLVDKFGERSSMLLRLLSLPVISPAATETMRSPQLEEFLKPSLPQEHGNGSLNSSSTEYIGNDNEVKSANLYYQAQKLISLCGWEPRSLPYIVECEHKSSQFVKDDNAIRSSDVVSSENNQSSTVHSAGTNEIQVINESSNVSGTQDCDPNSVVLDCKLCGASVGLWAFSLVPRPLEFFRFIGSTEVGNEISSGNHDQVSEYSADKRGDAGQSSLGGSGATFVNERSSNLNMTIAGGPTPTRQNFKAIVSLPIIGHNLWARFSCGSEFRDSLYIESENVQSKSSDDKSLQEGKLHDADRNENTFREGCTDNLPENLETESGNPVTKELNSQVKHSTATTSDANVISKVGETNEEMTTDNRPSSSLERGSNSNVCSDVPSDGHERTQVRDGSQISIGDKTPEKNAGIEITELPIKSTEFDPIRQHRHFCPWIASFAGGASGWQQTLSALLSAKERLHSSPSYSPTSAALIKMDDPLTSVRRLFMSPSQKRTKYTHSSS